MKMSNDQGALDAMARRIDAVMRRTSGEAEAYLDGYVAAGGDIDDLELVERPAHVEQEDGGVMVTVEWVIRRREKEEGDG